MVSVLTACGRIGIDPLAQTPADGSVEDGDSATPRVRIADGDACDDDNICSSSSHCVDGACVADSPASMCRVADSEDEFALVQGLRGWFYGFWFESQDPDATYALSDFTPFTIYGEIWRPADYQDDGPQFT